MEYYDILGIDKSASQNDIKKAYYKCSAKYHPDKTGGGDEALTEKFKQCNEAYEVLSDPEKRQSYDQYGKEGPPQFGFFNFNRKNKTEDLHIEISVTLEDLYYGKTINHKYNKHVCCKDCKGSGSSKDVKTTCTDCQGKGQKIQILRQGNTMYQTVGACTKCNATGIYIKEQDKCKGCHGQRIHKEEKTIKIEIEPGMSWGQQLKFYGSAYEQPDLLTGDLIIILSPKESQYNRQDNDLILNMNITLLQALNGKEIKLKHFDKELIFNDQLSPGDIRKLKNHGMPILNYPNKYGDLYIKFNVIFDLTDDQIHDIVQILNPNLTEKLKGLSLDKVNEIPKPKEKFNHHNNHNENVQQCTQQ